MHNCVKTLFILYIVITVVAQNIGGITAQRLSDDEKSPVESVAHVEENQQQPIDSEDEKKSEGTVDLNSVDRELFKRLFIKRRKEHLKAVQNLKKMDSYERQYKMINVLAETMFKVIESKKDLLDNFTEAELQNFTFSTASDTNSDIKDALSSVLENIALFGDVVLNLPDITQRILKTQPKWNDTIQWSFKFLNKTKDWLDKPTLEMIRLVLQELNITKRDPNYFNPNRKSNLRATLGESDKKTSATSKKEKRKKGPQMTKIEL